MACKNIQHSILFSEMVLYICNYKLKMESYMQIHLWNNTGSTNWVYKGKIAFVFTIAKSEHSSY